MGKKVYEIKEGDTLFAEKVSGDCWKMPNVSINRQVSGKYYFTDKRIAFMASGLIGTESVSWEIECSKNLSYASFFSIWNSNYNEKWG